MRLWDFRLLTDENIHPAVVTFLRTEGFDVLDVKEAGLDGTSDLHLIRQSRTAERVILTHDSDFGRLVFTTKERFTGVIYLRPGHIDPSYTIETVRAILVSEGLPAPPFIVVAERTDSNVRMRMRRIETTDE